MFMLYILATAGGVAEQIGAILQSKALINTGIISSMLMPSDAMYKKMTALVLSSPDNVLDPLAMTPFGNTHPPSTAMVLYAVIYLVIALLLAVRVFSRRDI